MVLDSFLAWTPWSVIVISFVLSLISSLIYKFFTNQEKIKELRLKAKEYQQQMKESRSQPDKMLDIQKESMQVTMQMFRQNLKPMAITLIPFLLVFSWLNSVYPRGVTVLTLPGVGWTLGFIGTYLIFSIIFSIIIRKVLKIH